jgi:transcriptional regulator with XRE-family HTH domain
VPEPASPTVRRKRLAAELRRLRERAELTGDFVAENMGWSTSKVSRIENARTTPSPEEIKKLLLLYGIDGPYAEDLVALAQDAKRKGWWKAYSDALPDMHTAYIGLEAEATSSSQWAPEVVAGLLQTKDYAREVIRASPAGGTIPPGEIERMVEARTVRQQILKREPAFDLNVVLDESVLLRRIGRNAVMSSQLERLLALSEYTNISLQVLCLDAPHPVTSGGFNLLQFGEVHDVGYHDITYIEHYTNSLYVEAERDTFQYQLAFRRLQEHSLDPHTSRARIARSQRTWE